MIRCRACWVATCVCGVLLETVPGGDVAELTAVPVVVGTAVSVPVSLPGVPGGCAVPDASAVPDGCAVRDGAAVRVAPGDAVACAVAVCPPPKHLKESLFAGDSVVSTRIVFAFARTCEMSSGPNETGLELAFSVTRDPGISL